MPVDPQVQQILEQGCLLPAMETLNVDAARKRCLEAFCTKDVLEYINQIQDKTLDIPVDQTVQKIRVRIYTPEAPAHLPILVYFHGGGFIIMHDAIDIEKDALIYAGTILKKQFISYRKNKLI